MKQKKRLPLFAIVTIFVFVFSFANTVIAFADDETPPAPTEEPTLPPTEEPTATAEPIPAPTEETVSLPEALDQLQNDTTVAVVVDGQVEPLATQDAANAIVTADPMWCPENVTPGSAGCTAPFGSFQDLYNELLLNQVNYNQAGVIWIEASYNSLNGVDDYLNFDLDGSAGFGTMSNYALTIQGGWSGGANANVDHTDSSVFSGSSLTIQNWNANVTINDLIFDEAAADAALYVSTTGDVALNYVQANNNDGGNGAAIENDGNTTVTNSQFNGNGYCETDGPAYRNCYGVGLITASSGTVTLNNVAADHNHDTGAFINSTSAVNIANSQFNGNGDDEIYTVPGESEEDYGDGNGLIVWSFVGDITLNNVTANENRFLGANVFTGGNVSITDSFFDRNGSVTSYYDLTGDPYQAEEYGDGYGLFVMSYGTVTLNRVSASNNTGTWFSKKHPASGALIFSAGGVSITDSLFEGNGYEGWWWDNDLKEYHYYDEGIGLFVESGSSILVQKSSASNNYAQGAVMIAPDSVTIKCSSFNKNNGADGDGTGLEIDLVGSGAGELYNVTATGNSTNFDLYGGGFTEYPGYNCNPVTPAPVNTPVILSENAGKNKTGKVNGSLHIIPVTGGFDCALYNGTMLILPNGDRAIYPCPLEDEGKLDAGTSASLPASLPDGANFVSSFTAHLLKNGVEQKEVEPFTIISFAIPEGADPDKLAILYWNGTGWVEVENATISSDGHFEAPVNFMGTFVLVTK